MKVTVKGVFVDKITGELYQPGRKINIEDIDRVKDLVDRGLVEKAEVKVEKVETADKTPKKTKK